MQSFTRSCIPLLVFSLIAFSAYAQPPQHRGDKEKRHDALAELNLTEKQKADLQALREENRAERKDHFTKAKELRRKIKGEMLKDNPDRAVLRAYSREMSAMHAAAEEKRIDHLLAVKKILTAEQFEKMLNLEWRRDRKQKHEGAHDCGMPGKECPHHGKACCPRHKETH